MKLNYFTKTIHLLTLFFIFVFNSQCIMTPQRALKMQHKYDICSIVNTDDIGKRTTYRTLNCMRPKNPESLINMGYGQYSNEGSIILLSKDQKYKLNIKLEIKTTGGAFIDANQMLAREINVQKQVNQRGATYNNFKISSTNKITNGKLFIHGMKMWEGNSMFENMRYFELHFHKRNAYFVVKTEFDISKIKIDINETLEEVGLSLLSQYNSGNVKMNETYTPPL